jgi:hypothetical protein
MGLPAQALPAAGCFRGRPAASGRSTASLLARRSRHLRLSSLRSPNSSKEPGNEVVVGASPHRGGASASPRLPLEVEVCLLAISRRRSRWAGCRSPRCVRPSSHLLMLLGQSDHRTSRSRVCSSSWSRRSRGILEGSPVRKVSSAHARKQAAPSDVFQLHAAWSIIDPVEGTT